MVARTLQGRITSVLISPWMLALPLCWLGLIFTSTSFAGSSPETLHQDGFESTPTSIDDSDWWPDPQGELSSPSHTPAGSAITDFRAEHITPFGAWFVATAAATEEFGWDMAVCWSTTQNGLDTSTQLDALISTDSCRRFDNRVAYQSKQLPVMIIAQMEPATTYYVRATGVNFLNSSNGEFKSNVVRVVTKADPRHAISATHPTLITNTAHLQALRARYQAGDTRMQGWIAAIRPRTDNAISPNPTVYAPDQYATGAAILGEITGQTSYLDGAKRLLLERLLPYYEALPVNNAYRGAGAELAYVTDLVWTRLTAQERQRILTAMLATDELDLNAFPNWDNTDQYIANLQAQLSHGLLFLGDASISVGDRQRLEVIFDRAMRRWYGEMLVKLRRADRSYGLAGGSLDDGTDYLRGTQSHWLEVLWFMDNAGFPQSAYAPWVWNNARSNNLHNAVPGLTTLVTFGDIEDGDLLPGSVVANHAGWSTDAFKLCLLDRFGRTAEAAYLRDLLLSTRAVNSNEPGHFPGLLCDHDGLGRTPIAGLPTTYVDRGFGHVYDRSSWGSNASYLFFSAGWRGVDHSHNDAGHFSLWANGAWITHELPAYDDPPGWLAGLHNVLLLGSEGQEVYGASGQAGESVRIVRVEASSAHLFVLANLTSAYNYLTGVTQVTRSLYWDKASNRVVVYDRVVGFPSGTTIDQQVRAPAVVARLHNQTTNGVREVLSVVNGTGSLSISTSAIGVAGTVAFDRATGERLP